MLQENVQPPPQQQQPAGQTPQIPVDQALPIEEHIRQIAELRGKAPVFEEGTDPNIRERDERMYMVETRMMINDAETAIRQATPKASDLALQKFTAAVTKGDYFGAWQAAQDSARIQAEKEQNDTKLDNLRVEGAGGGNRGQESDEPKSLTEVMMRIDDEHRS